jgi:hypothetical protein
MSALGVNRICRDGGSDVNDPEPTSRDPLDRPVGLDYRVDHSGRPAFRRPSSYLARSSGRQ